MTGEEFRREVTAEKAELTDDQREEIQQATSMLRALGLVEGQLDLFEASNDLAGAGILGLYSYEDERIRIRGTTLTPASESTLVHELTHALQDQHFDLGERFDDSSDSSESNALRALVEGDASRIETAYQEGLSDKKRAKLDEEQAAVGETFEQNVKDISQILRTFAVAPYALGEALLQLAVVIDGNDAVDALFRDPPKTEEHLLDPWTLLQDHDRALEVTKPRLGAGEEELDSGPFGAVTWYLLLAERLPLVDAFDAADGWGGDSYVAFERDGVSCVRIHYKGDNALDGVQMHRALRTWIAALPGAPASVQRVGPVLRFESCDPGPAADVGSQSSDTALQLALARTYVAVGFLRSTGERAASRCFAEELVHVFTPEQIADPNLGAGDPVIQQQIHALATACL